MADEKRLTAKDFSPEVLQLFDRYVHGQVDRRGFLEQAAKFALAGTSALGLLNALSPRFAEAQQVSPDDARLHTEWVELASPEGYDKLRGYLVYTKKPASKRGAVLVVHENRGLNPHIQDIARRIALDGFVAFAPDALFPIGGYPGDEDKARVLFAQLDQERTRGDFIQAAEYLRQAPRSNGKVGVVGFCWGGMTTNQLAARLPWLKAAVPFYGAAPPLPLVKNTKAELLIHRAESDEPKSDWPKYEQALIAGNIKYQSFLYPGTQHGFNNDTTPRYDEAAAKLAWQRTIALFKRKLK